MANGLLEKNKIGTAGEILDKNSIPHDRLIFAGECDMNEEFIFADGYIAFDGKNIYTIEGKAGDPEAGKRKKKTFSEFTCERIRVYKNVKKLIIEKNLTTCTVVAENESGQHKAGYLSFAFLTKAGGFCDDVNYYIENKKIRKKKDAIRNKCASCGQEIPYGRSYCNECSKKKLGFQRVFAFFGEYKFYIALVLFFMLLESALALVVPQFSTKELYDKILNVGNTAGYEQLFGALLVTVGTVALLRVINLVVRVVYQYTTESVLPKVTLDIKMKIFSSMQKLSLAFFTSKQTGSLMERVSRDANNIYFFMVDGLPGVLTNIIRIVGIAVMMFIMSPKLSLILFVAAPLVIIPVFFCNEKLRMIHHRLWLRQAGLASSVNDKVNGHRVIKSFAKEDDEVADFTKISEDLVEAQVKSRYVESVVFPFFGMSLFIVATLVFFIGGYMTLKGQMSVGTLMTFVVYLDLVRDPIESFIRVFNWWERCVDSSRRVFEIIDAKPDITEIENPSSSEITDGKIEIRNVNFEYEVGRPVIKNMNLNIEPGTMLGVVGKTGAGKSTLVNLISRLYDTKSGDIFIDGVNVRDMSFEKLRKNVGMVSQEIFLFMGSIADNIRYAVPDAPFKDVVAASKAAGAHEFIMKLPDGYETRIGSGGQGLSGGERQRISIARTIMQNPKILILDEATASMDTQTERRIQQSVSKLKEGRTTIAIAHRLSTLKDADKIAVITKGELSEYGTFEELIKMKGQYYNLYKIQNDLRKQMVFGAEE